MRGLRPIAQYPARVRGFIRYVSLPMTVLFFFSLPVSAIGQSELIARQVLVDEYKLFVSVDKYLLSSFNCQPSDYQGIVACNKESERRSKGNTIYNRVSIAFKDDSKKLIYAFSLHRQSGGSLRSSFLARVERLSRQIGRPVEHLIVRLPDDEHASHLVYWGSIELVPLSDSERGDFIQGNLRRGYLVDYSLSLGHSATQNHPIYAMKGSIGFIINYRVDNNGSQQLASRVIAPEAFSLTPDVQLVSLWSDCELADRNPEISIPACTKVLASGPASRRTEAFHNRGVAYAKKGELDRAISDVTEGIRLDPRHAFRFQERGELYLKKGDFGRAMTDLNEAIRIDPTRSFRFHSRALAYKGAGDLSRAIDDFSEAIRLDPIKRAFRFYERAGALSEVGQYENAITDYNEVLQLEPTNGWAFLDRGRAYARTGQIALAKRDFAAVLSVPDLNPQLLAAVESAVGGLPGPIPPPPPPLPPPPPPSPSSPPPDHPRPGLERLLGTWNSDAKGENIVIKKSPLGGFEAWLSHLGQGSLGPETKKGANIQVSTRDVTCLYLVTLTQDGTNWQLREGPEEKCISGQFTRVPDSDE